MDGFFFYPPNPSYTFPPNPFYRRWWFGIPVPIWLNRMEMIKAFIKENDLKPADLETLPITPFMNQAAGAELAERAPKVRWPGFPGGIRIPHLHYRGDIFLLKEEVWQNFSTGLVKDLQGRLGKAKSVSFEQAMEISEAIDSLGVR
jgi:hypothetical protein